MIHERKLIQRALKEINNEISLNESVGMRELKGNLKQSLKQLDAAVDHCSFRLKDTQGSMPQSIREEISKAINFGKSVLKEFANVKLFGVGQCDYATKWESTYETTYNLYLHRFQNHNYLHRGNDLAEIKTLFDALAVVKSAVMSMPLNTVKIPEKAKALYKQMFAYSRYDKLSQLYKLRTEKWAAEYEPMLKLRSRFKGFLDGVKNEITNFVKNGVSQKDAKRIVYNIDELREFQRNIEGVVDDSFFEDYYVKDGVKKCANEMNDIIDSLLPALRSIHLSFQG